MQDGRPLVLPNTEPSEEGTLVYPSLQGSTNWFSPSYSPATGLLYVSVREMGAHYYKTPAEYEPGKPFLGGGEQALQGDEAYGAAVLKEIETRTGRGASAGAIYTALERMERKGFVSSRFGPATPQRGGKPKKFYAIEPAGSEALNRSYDALRQMADGVVAKLQS